MSVENYLAMQRHQYEQEAGRWTTIDRDHVVGSYDAHNGWSDYDTLLFKDFDTSGMIALEYGCGPARNLIRYNNRFARIDGVDLAENNLIAARVNLEHHGLVMPNLYLNDGSTMPMIKTGSYDVVFSVICLQHIASHTIRYSIMTECFRVLKAGGRFCFQMGFGGRTAQPTTPYFENDYGVLATNGWHDVALLSEADLQNDLTRIGFVNYRSDIATTGPGDNHQNWIWVQVEKPQ